MAAGAPRGCNRNDPTHGGWIAQMGAGDLWEGWARRDTPGAIFDFRTSRRGRAATPFAWRAATGADRSDHPDDVPGRRCRLPGTENSCACPASQQRLIEPTLRLRYWGTYQAGMNRQDPSD